MATLVPVAQSYLNFRGDVRDDLSIGQRMGPTTYRAWMYVVSVAFIASENRTVVGMSAVKP